MRQITVFLSPVGYYLAASPRILALLLMMALLLPVQVSSQHYDYDKNISKLVDKVVQYPGSKKKKEELAKLFHEANQIDRYRIDMLRQSGQPDIWHEIYMIYKRLDARQKTVKALPLSTLAEIGFEYIDYENDIREASIDAAAFLYAHAEMLLHEKNPEKARQAYDELLLIAHMFEKYRDIGDLIRQAVALGAADVHFVLVNNTGKELNSYVIEEISRAFSGYRMEQSTTPDGSKPSGSYDFNIQIVVEEISVTRDQIKTLEYIEERDIFDVSGQVVDTISCTVSEFHQRKGAEVKGYVQYIDNGLNAPVNTTPVMAESVFLHAYGSLQGNIDACGDETRALIVKKEAAYPSNASIVMDAVMKFTGSVKKVLMPQQKK